MLTLNVQHVLRVQRRFRRNGDCGENTWERVTAVANDAASASPDLQQAELAQLDDLDQRVIVKMNIMGTAVDVSMTAAQAAKFRLLQQAGAAEKKRRVDKARTAIKRYDWAPNEPRRKAALRAIDSCSLYARYETRLTCFLSFTGLAPPDISSTALMAAWPRSPAPSNVPHYLLPALKHA